LQCGEVKDIVVLKDKPTGASRGCAFVSYATSEEAQRAICVLDKAVHLPGASQPMEVRFARSSNFVLAGQGPDNNKQLFFAHMPTATTEEEISRLFSQFGQVGQEGAWVCGWGGGGGAHRVRDPACCAGQVCQLLQVCSVPVGGLGRRRVYG
jgi:RNA recognition motif-containing protein